MAGWDSLKELVKEEITQRREEGCIVTGFKEEWGVAGDDEKKLMEIYHQLMQLEIKEDFNYVEPSELEDIRRERPEGPRQLKIDLTKEQLMDKFYGAWIGRSIGCALGKPLECGPYMSGAEGNPGWKNIKLWFEGADAWPIANYTPSNSRAREEHNLFISTWCNKSELDNIRFMESDDDIRYTVLGLIMLEEKGLEWDSWDIGKLWHKKLSFAQVCTAETQAYLNFCQVTAHMKGEKPEDWKSKLQWVRTYLNPYREWIGAQIRVDGFAYGAAGNPELAAEFGWRDASFSHVKNGIYGEMFIGAMIAAAFAENDVEKVIEIGLSEIPKNCRLAWDVKKAIGIAKGAKNQEELVSKIYDTFKELNCVHTNNNAALCVAALIFAKGDYEKAITTAVFGGWDTDCNGATVGSIMGAMVGASKIPQKWTAPLNDTLFSDIIDFHPIKISECAERSYKTFLKIEEQRHCK
ncbi:MAG TPA: ADP-ribosylglycohydrolase family protein [Clostridiaceae bacterium]